MFSETSGKKTPMLVQGDPRRRNHQGARSGRLECAAHDRTGIAAADSSRIRNADLGRFTVDRLISILNRLGSRVEVKVRVWRTEPVEERAPA